MWDKKEISPGNRRIDKKSMITLIKIKKFLTPRGIFNFRDLLKFLLRFPHKKFRYLRYKKLVNSEIDLEVKFTQIWRWNIWGSKESRSGEGSTLSMTEGIRNNLPKIISQFRIKSIFDGPCGDFNWMKDIDLSEVRYVGADIVKPIIIDLKRKYTRPNISFLHHDLTLNSIPQSDLVLTRDCLFHFSYGDIGKFLEKFLESNSKFLLTTSHLNDNNFTNIDIVTGDFRLLDLFMEPFLFPKNFHFEIKEPGHSNHAPRALYLWDREQIRRAFANFNLALTNLE